MVTLVVNYMVVDLVVGVIAALVTNVLAGVLVIVDTSVAVFLSSISPTNSGTGDTLEALGLLRLFLSLILGISAL